MKTKTDILKIAVYAVFVFCVVGLVWVYSLKVQAEDIQPDHDTVLGGTWIEGYYIQSATSTYNQVYWWQEDGKPFLFSDIQTSNGVSTTSYSATSAFNYGTSSTGTGVNISCITDNISSTTNITINTGNTLRIGGNAYSEPFYGNIYGESVGGRIAFGLSYNPVDCTQLPDSSTITRIIEVVPEHQSTYATSTTFTFSGIGYVNENDFIDGLIYKIKLNKNENQQAVGALLAFQSAFGSSFEFPIEQSGYFEVSTTTTMEDVGEWTMVSSIERPYFSLFGLDFGTQVLVSTSTRFTVDSLTDFDLFFQAQEEVLQDAYSNFATSTCSISGGNFDLGRCIVGIFIPSGNAFTAYQELPRILESKFPFSYINSVSVVWTSLTASTTENAPELEYNLADLGIGSTTAMGNVLPDFTVFSASTTKQYFGDALFDAFKALASVALILALILDIFFTTRNLIKT